MGGDERLFTGGCLCGKVRFEAQGPPLWAGFCHCASCRRATGGALVVASGFKRTAVTIGGEGFREFASSPGVQRGFCRLCGTSLSYRNELWPEDLHLMIGAFDQPAALEPQLHIFVGEQLPWLCLADKLTRYRTTPSAGDVVRG